MKVQSSKRKTLRIAVRVLRDKERLARASSFAEDGSAGRRLKPIVAKTFALDEIVEARHDMSQTGCPARL
jgi:hypothetical protein